MIHMFKYFFPNKVKNVNLKVYNLISEANKTKFSVRHKSCECECRLNENAWNSKQKWSHNERVYECKK